MVLANQNAKLTGPDQGFLVSRLVLTLKPWERGWEKPYKISLYQHSVVRMFGNFSLSELFSRVSRTRDKHATRPRPLTVTYLSSIPFSHNLFNMARNEGHLNCACSTFSKQRWRKHSIRMY